MSFRNCQVDYCGCTNPLCCALLEAERRAFMVFVLSFFVGEVLGVQQP